MHLIINTCLLSCFTLCSHIDVLHAGGNSGGDLYINWQNVQYAFSQLLHIYLPTWTLYVYTIQYVQEVNRSHVTTYTHKFRALVCILRIDKLPNRFTRRWYTQHTKPRVESELLILLIMHFIGVPDIKAPPPPPSVLEAQLHFIVPLKANVWRWVFYFTEDGSTA